MLNYYSEGYPQIDRLLSFYGDNNGKLTLPYLSSESFIPFPQMRIQFTPTNAYFLKSAETAVNEGRYVFYEFSDEKIEDFSDIKGNVDCPCGVIGIIRQITVADKRPATVIFDCVCRAEKKSLPYLKDGMISVIVEPIKEIDVKKDSSNTSSAAFAKLTDAYTAYVRSNGEFDEKTLRIVSEIEDLGILCDFIAENSFISVDDKLDVLNELDIEKRAAFLSEVLEADVEILKYMNELSGKIQKNVLASKKEYFIREQIRVLKEEINDNSEEATDYYSDRIASLAAPDEVKEKLKSEAEKLWNLPEASQEFSVISTYLDCCLSIPWGVYGKDLDDVAAAAEILEKDHYGLKKVKDRIVEFLAVKKLTGKTNAQILCLIGPPGTGKTSIAQSIAKACNRKFERIALGGIRDENEIRGHRRTYLASMPGRIMDAVIHAKVSNPVILLDEVDKLGADYKGDPSAALLEVLDPEQNKTFKDHYIDLPFDLGNVIFIATANNADTIPLPLYDRMEIIELSSYTDEEKFNIAKSHLIPKQLEKHGLTSEFVEFDDGAIREMIKSYTKEAGVRGLEKKIAEILRKIAKKTVVDGKTEKTEITSENLSAYLGVPKFKDDAVDLSDKVGVVNGLAYTSVGGELLPIEAAALKGTGKIEITGSLGDVMKESVRTAVSFVRTVADEFGIDPDFYKNKDIHLHFPEGAVPKDGPSAGIGIATALISELSGIKVDGKTAMTGEITLRGNVLPIGGLKEKTMAAYKSGMKRVIIPKLNLPDLEETDDAVRNALEFVPVEKMTEVLSAVLKKEN